MIVPAKEAALLLGDRLTVLRVPQTRVEPKEGKLVSVQVGVRRNVWGRERCGTEEKCRVHITGVKAGTLGSVTPAELRAFRCRFRPEFYERWGERWNVPSPGPDTPCWVVRVERERDEPDRYLSLGVIAFRQGDYVRDPHRSLDGVPTVPDSDLERFACEARRRDQRRALERWDGICRLDPRERVRALAAEARRRHVDVRDELRDISRYGLGSRVAARSLDAIERKLAPPRGEL